MSQVRLDPHTKKEPPEQITSFDELIETYQWHENDLQKKHDKIYFLRFLLRRIPLYAGVGFIFFGVCLLLTWMDIFDSETVNKFLQSLIMFGKEWRDWILIGGALLLFLLTLLPSYWVIDKPNSNTYKMKRSKYWESPCANVLLLCILLSGFSWVLSHSNPLLAGFSIFTTFTFIPLLADRTLGFTRRTERLKLFQHRVQFLMVASRSRKIIPDENGNPIQFNESHLVELKEFLDALSQDKHKATISDSFYLLRQPRTYLEAKLQ